MSSREVHFLEADPELLDGVDAEVAAEARSSAVASTRRVESGEWSPSGDEFGSASGFGLLILEGFLARRVALAERWCVELLGQGDVLHPWLDDGEYTVMPFEASFRVLEPLEVAVLDRPVAEAICRWPGVVRNLMTRVMMRSRNLAGLLALVDFPRVETRVHVLLWHLAERFGHVTRDGVVIRLPISHELLGGMVVARRPTVTTALGQLEEQGLVVAQGRQRWLLRGEPKEMRSFPTGLGELTV